MWPAKNSNPVIFFTVLADYSMRHNMVTEAKMVIEDDTRHYRKFFLQGSFSKKGLCMKCIYVKLYHLSFFCTI